MKRWWNTNRYKVCRVIFFPIWIVVLVKDEVCESRYRNIQWSESRADRIIAKTVPQKLEVCDDELVLLPRMARALGKQFKTAFWGQNFWP